MASTNRQQPHFLLIPYSEQGHVNPMLSLASHLLRLGCRVTFVKADRHLPSSPSFSSFSAEDDAAAGSAAQYNSQPSLHQLHFVTLPVRNKALCIDPKTMIRFQIFKNTLAGLEDRQDLIATIIEESKTSPHPITCIICDLFLWRWVRHLACAHPPLHSAAFCIFSAPHPLLLLSLHPWQRGGELLVSELGMPSNKDKKAYLGLYNMQDSFELKLEKRNCIFPLYEGFKEFKTIFVNSFEALEAPLLPLLQASSLDGRFIGPCISEWHKDGSVVTSMEKQATNIFIEDTTCLTWLDQQEKGSVLYVAFGSEGEISSKQFEEIELGIKRSGYKFLWAMRSNTLTNNGLKNDLSKKNNLQGKEMFVSWAPQKQVLQHAAMGGFLTHSG